MRTRFSSVLLATALGTAACGGDGSTGPDTPTFESIAGSYAGSMVGVSQGVALDADFGLTITQSSSALSGSYSISGTLTDGIDVVTVQGTGVLTGAIEAGDNPSVNITVTPGACPTESAQFSGTYDSANQRLTLTGPVEFFGVGTCDVVLSYPMTIILNR